MNIGLHVKYPLFWSEFNEKSVFQTQISNFFKIRPVGAELFRADRLTDGHDEANSRFSQFFERT